MNYKVHHPTGNLIGKLSYGGSKSISNRVLIIKYLCQDNFKIENLSDSDDTKSLIYILDNISEINDVHHAGTTFRFLTSVLALKKGDHLLTGSQRMKERPIGPLVKALNDLGCSIDYVEKEGFPPLNIRSPRLNLGHDLSIDGSVSSQYLSSLLLVAPTLVNGLNLTIIGELVSKPYLDMTLSIMAYFGIKYQWTENTINIAPQRYVAKDFFVESDWSSASYYFSLAAFSRSAKLSITGLKEDSLQADSQIKEIAKQFGVKHQFGHDLEITKEVGSKIAPFIEQDFITCPDIAQTVFVMCGGLNVKGVFSGLQTLKIKETDRIVASATELSKVGSFLTKVPQRFTKKTDKELFMIDGECLVDNPVFETYHDHRMAMAFASFALKNPIVIKDANVVTKSYPTFWEDLEKLGFVIQSVD